MRTFAVGDVHGMHGCMLAALAVIEKEAPIARVIFLGDYIDRGPDSRLVVETLMRGPRRAADEWICLKGNHEAMMVETIRTPLDQDWWVGNGGGTTIESFGGLPSADVVGWCDRLPLTYETEHHLFVHAGIRPGVPLDEQDKDELLWIREPFLIHEQPFPKHIVHGHTPNSRPELMPNRTNLDSGAFFSGVLSVAEFDLSTPGGPAKTWSIQCK